MTTRLRSRSSVEHIFDLVEDLDEDQLSDLLHEMNSSTDTNVPVSRGVEYFEEQRRTRGPPKVLRPTPSFLNQQQHEPRDWPKQKPRAVSGSQWRQSMRVVSPPYSAIGRHQTEPISPPLTASPPLSPPLSPPKHHGHHHHTSSTDSPRRSVTAPILSIEKTPRVDVESVPLERPVSPPVHEDEEQQQHESQPNGFASFSFGADGASPATPQRQQQSREVEKEENRPLSPQESPRQPPTQRQQQPDFSRINTMPPLSSFQDPVHGLPRPRTSTGDAATTANAFKPRAFRRISRPTFLSPTNIPAPDALAQRLSQYIFEEPSPLSMPSMTALKPAAAPEPEPSFESLLKEPAAPPSMSLFGSVEKEVPSVGIFEVLTEG